ncbi:MAG: sigma-70 family RNA polymerase sigma factor [Christensenellaceae bacterium]
MSEEVCTDEQLVARFKAGDAKAMETLLLSYRAFVKRKARRFFLVGGETEDLVQEGMIGIYEAALKFDGTSSFRSFASLCVERRIIDAVKSSNRLKNKPLNTSVSLEESEDMPSGLSPELLVIDSENQQEFYQRMGRVLSDFEFRVVVSYIGGMSIGEIADALGKPYKSVDNGLQRARNKLRKEME